MHFRDQQELIRFLRSKPVEPKRYVEKTEVKQVKKQVTEEREQDGKVLQAD